MSPWSWYMQMMAANSPWLVAPEQGVGREGAFHGQARGLGLFDRGDDDSLFFVAEHAVFAGVGVEGRHPQGHAGQPEVPVQGPGGEVEKPHQAFLGDPLAAPRTRRSEW